MTCRCYRCGNTIIFANELLFCRPMIVQYMPSSARPCIRATAFGLILTPWHSSFSKQFPPGVPLPGEVARTYQNGSSQYIPPTSWRPLTFLMTRWKSTQSLKRRCKRASISCLGLATYEYNPVSLCWTRMLPNNGWCDRMPVGNQGSVAHDQMPAASSPYDGGDHRAV